jgi:hypothetical protein
MGGHALEVGAELDARSSEETRLQAGEILMKLSEHPACILHGEALEGWLWRQERESEQEPAIWQRGDTDGVVRHEALRERLVHGGTRGDEQQVQGYAQEQGQRAHSCLKHGVRARRYQRIRVGQSPIQEG